MVTPVPAPAVLNREFLEIRCKILEVAAALDRLDRGSGSVAKDPRLEKLLEAHRHPRGRQRKSRRTRANHFLPRL